MSVPSFSIPPLSVAWPSVASLGQGAWAGLLADAPRTLQQFHQAQRYTQPSSSDPEDVVPVASGDEDAAVDVSAAEPAERGASPGAGGDAGASSNGSESKQDDAAGDQIGLGSSAAQLALDTEVQTASWLLASQTRARSAATPESTATGTGLASNAAPLRLPARLTKSWQKEVSDFSLSKSSFGGLYEKRMHILRSLFATFQRDEAQQLIREANEAALAASGAASRGGGGFGRKPASSSTGAFGTAAPSGSSGFGFSFSSPARPSSSNRNAGDSFAASLSQGWELGASGASPSPYEAWAMANALQTPVKSSSSSNNSNSAAAASRAAPDVLTTMTLPGSVWSQLPGRDPSAPDWAAQVPALLEALGASSSSTSSSGVPAGALLLRRDYVAREELEAFLSRASAALDALAKQDRPRELESALAAVVAVAVSSGWPSLVLAAVRLLLAHAGDARLSLADAGVRPFLEQLAEHQSQLDISAPFASALLWSHAQPLPSQMPAAQNAGGLSQPNHNIFGAGRGASGPSMAQGLACDGPYLYVHTRDGLEKIGSGFCGTTKGQRYAYRPEYRNQELVRLAAIGGKLYALSSRLAWPRVEVLSAATLATLGQVQLGVDPEFSSPAAAAKNGINHMMTDGRLLYLLSAEEVEEPLGDRVAATAAEQLLSMLGELEEAKKSDVQVADLDVMKVELLALLQSLRAANEEHFDRDAQESASAPRRKQAGKSKGKSSTEVKFPLPLAFGSRNNSVKAEEEAKPAASASSSSSASAAPAAAAPAEEKKIPAILKKVRDAQALTMQMLAATRAANSAGSKTPKTPAQGDSAAAASHLVYPASAAASPATHALRVPASSSSSSSDAAAGSSAGSVVRLGDLSSLRAALQFGTPSRTPSVASASGDEKKPAAASSAASAESKAPRKITKISLWVYDPLGETDGDNAQRAVEEDLFVTQDECEARLAEAARRADAARDIAEEFEHVYSLRVCITALRKCKDDRNAAARWLLDHGDEYRRVRCLPLVRSLVLANNYPSVSADFLAASVSACVTTSQLVLVLPPHCGPWTQDERSLVRVLSLEDGMLFEECRGQMTRQNSQLCFDARNNVLWAGVLQHSVHVSCYRNHGPAAPVTTVDVEPKSLSLVSGTKKTEAEVLEKKEDVPLGPNTVFSVLPRVESLSTPRDIALFLLAHVDRNLLHRDISSYTERSALEHLRAQVQALSMQQDVLRVEKESLQRAQSSASDAEALLSALPSMDMLDDVGSDAPNEFPASPQGQDVEALLAAVLSGERMALAALVDRRNNPNRAPSSARRFGASSSSGPNGGTLRLPAEKASVRLVAVESRIAATEAAMASATAALAELEAKQASKASSVFCAHAPSQPFSIELEDDLFTQLHALMEFVLQGANSGKVSGGDGGKLALSPSGSYIAQVSLRLLKVHLELLLKLTQTAPGGIPPISRSRALRNLLLDMAMSDDEEPAQAKEPQDAEKVATASDAAASSAVVPSSRTGVAPAAGGTPTPSLKAFACAVLISGIRIFYPSQSERIALLTGLIADFALADPSASSSASGSSADSGASSLLKKKQELLLQVMTWFGSQTALSDILLVNKDSGVAAPASSKEGVVLALSPSPSPSPSDAGDSSAGASGAVDAGAFIRSLLQYSLQHEFAPFKTRTQAAHLLAVDKPAPIAAAASASSNPYASLGVKVAAAAAAASSVSSGTTSYPPCLSLLLVLQMDLIIKSGLLALGDKEDQQGPRAIQGKAAQQQQQQQRGGKSPRKKGGKAEPAAPAAAVAPASADELPASSPLLQPGDSSVVSRAWGGLSPHVAAGAASSASAPSGAAVEVPFETSLLSELASSAAAPSAARAVLQRVYMDKLLEHALAVLERAEALVEDLGEEESRAGGAKRPAANEAVVTTVTKQSILILLPSLLTALGSPLLASHCPEAVKTLLPRLQSLLRALDALNSAVPSLRSHDARFSRLLSNEHTRVYQFETAHPYPSGYRVFKQTLSVPGASHIAFAFDPRSCSANGNDTLRFYADSAMTKPLGHVLYGNDRDGNATWTRNGCILIPGDQVTLCFSAKGQQKQRGGGGGGHADQSVRWGFKCSARGVFLNAMPWLLDLEHTVAGLMGRCIAHCIAVAPVSAAEVAARGWFQYPLMRRGLEDHLLLAAEAATSEAASATTSASSASSALAVSLTAGPAKSPALAFLDRFVEGAPETALLSAELERSAPPFSGRMLLKRLPQALQDAWARAIRATMAAMIKHSGLAQDVYAVFGAGAAGDAAEEKKSSPDSLGLLSSRARSLLQERLKLVSSSAKGLQSWMVESVQAHNEWNAWFAPARMSAVMEPKKKARKVAIGQANAAVAAAGSAAPGAPQPPSSDNKKSPAVAGGAPKKAKKKPRRRDRREHSRSRSRSRSDSEHDHEHDNDEEDYPDHEHDEEDLDDFHSDEDEEEDEEGSAFEGEGEEEEEEALTDCDEDEEALAAAEAASVAEAIEAAEAAVAAAAGAAAGEEKESEQKEPEESKSDDVAAKSPVSPPATSATPEQQPATTAAEEEEVEKELSYQFQFGLTELREEYHISQVSKIRALLAIKRIRLRGDTAPGASSAAGAFAASASAFDMDEALSKLLIAMERERRELQLHARLHPTEAYHLLDPALIKQHSYSIVIDGVYASAKALMCFRAVADETATASSLSPPMSPSASTAAATPAAAGADSDDMPAAGAPKFMRAASELPTSSAASSAAAAAESMISRTLSREAPVGSAGAGTVGAGVPALGGSGSPVGAIDERAEDLRSWVNTYSRWKSWQTQHQPLKSAAAVGGAGGTEVAPWQLAQTSPLDVVRNLIRDNLDARALVRIAFAQQRRAGERQRGFEALARALDSVSFEAARVNLVGLLPQALTLFQAPESSSGSASSSSSGASSSGGASAPSSSGPSASSGAPSVASLAAAADDAPKPLVVASASGSSGAAGAGLFLGMETANMAAKAAVQAAHGGLLQVLLSLLKPSAPRSINLAPMPANSPHHSTLFTDSYVPPPRRNCYASRLLALEDVFALPFAPLRLSAPSGAAGSAGAAALSPSASSSSPAASPPPASSPSSSRVLSSARTLFSLLSESLSVSRWLRRLEPSIAAEVAKDHLTLHRLIQRELAQEKAEREVRQAQEQLAAQLAEDKRKREEARQAAEAEARRKAEEAARVRAERLARAEASQRAAAEARAAGGAAADGSDAAAASPKSEEDEMLGMNLFDSADDGEDDGAAAAASPASSPSMSAEEKARQAAEEAARVEAEYLRNLQRQFGDQDQDQDQGDEGEDADRGARGGRSGRGGRASGAGRGGFGGQPRAAEAAPSSSFSASGHDLDESGHMAVVQNRHGQNRSVWVPGNKPDDKASAKRASKKTPQEQQQRNWGEEDQGEEQQNEDEEEEGDDAQDDVEESGSSSSPSSSSSASSPAAGLPSIDELNSAFATKEWAALRLTMVQLLQWSEPRVRAELAHETEATKSAVLGELSALRQSVLRQLTRELIAALDLARTLWRHNHSWHIRSKLLELLEQLLTFFLLISPAVAVGGGGAPTQQLALSLLHILHESAALTPRIVVLALRLARRVLPQLDCVALWETFVSQASTSSSSSASSSAGSASSSPLETENGGLVKHSPALVGSSLSEWLVHRIGALLTAESREEHQANMALASKKREEARKALAEQAEKEVAAKKKAAPAATAASTGSEEKAAEESKSSDAATAAATASPTPTAPSSDSLPLRTHALTVHYRDGFTVDHWTSVLSKPELLELAYGIRGVQPPKQEDVQARAVSEFARRNRARRGPAKVVAESKSGSLEVNTDTGRIQSRSGFSTFVANVGVTSGRWYYQVILQTRGLLQIGWATKQHAPSSAEGQGTGDDSHSWAYDGMRLKRWHQSPADYSRQRWNAGDIVGCMLDLDVPGGEMSFSLNGENLGVAFAGFYSADMGPLYPAASISASECASWMWHPDRMQKKGSMRSRVPEGYFPLEGDKAVQGNMVPARRAGEVARNLEFAGHFTLIESDREYCERMAHILATEHGVTCTVQPSELLESLTLADPTAPNEEVSSRVGAAAYPKQIQTGAVTQAFASELVAFCRFVLDSSRSDSAWAAQMEATLRKALHASPALLQSEEGMQREREESDTLLGALCVLGGFTESLRIGGLVRVGGEGGSSDGASSLSVGVATRGLVVQAPEHASFVRAVYLSELLSSAAASGPAAAASEVLSHRLSVGGALVPVPELQVDLNMFALDAQAFAALQKRIEAALPAPASSGASSSTAASGQPRSLYRWLLGELKWRSVAVLESLLTHSSLSSSSSSVASSAAATPTVDMLLRIAELLVSHSKSCRPELKLEQVSALSNRLAEKAWDLRNCVDAQLAPVPFRRRRALQSASPGSGPPPSSFDTIYSSSSYREEKVAAAVPDDALLRYWEKYIIPPIQNYVKSSFKPWEMEMYTAQLRQPLRANDQAAAIEIAMTLTGQHLPDGVVFPDDSHDFLMTTLDDVVIGSCYSVGAAAAASDLWVAEMDQVAGRIGRAKAVHPGEELVLLQFYEEQQAVLFEWWLPVESLRLVNSARHERLAHLRDAEQVCAQLEEAQASLSPLIARRAIFTLLARGGDICTRFLSHQFGSAAAGSASASSVDDMLSWVFLAVSECLELSDLQRLGHAAPAQRDALAAFQANLIAFLDAQRAAGTLSTEQLVRSILRSFKDCIAKAARFTQDHSVTSSFTVQPAQMPAAVVGQPPPRSNDSADLWLSLRVPHASALILLFSRDTRLSKGSLLSVYPDESASELVKSWSGREESPPELAPLVCGGEQAYLHCTPPSDIPARSSIMVLPLSSYLPLAFWLADLVLTAGATRGAGEATTAAADSSAASSGSASASASSSSVVSASSTSSSSSRGGPWSDGAEGGLVGLCYTLCEIVLENFSLQEIAPSPLKEALLKLVASLIATVTQAKHGLAGAAGGVVDASSDTGPLARPGLARQLSVAQTASQTRSLQILKSLHSELVSLYALESVNLVFSSYVQQLVDLLAASDELRPEHDRLCTKWEFALEPTAEEAAQKAREMAEAEAKAKAEEAEPAVWVCTTCTFENVLAAPGCDMCGSPKPKMLPKKAAAGGAGGSADASSQDSGRAFHDMTALVSAMRLLKGDLRPESSPPVRAMLESVWRSLRRNDLVDKRVLIVENVPAGEPALVKAELVRALRGMDGVGGAIRLEPEDIFLGTDPRKPPIKEPEAEQPSASQQAASSSGFLRRRGGTGGGGNSGSSGSGGANKNISSFAFKSVGDENGVLYHLGALAKEQQAASGIGGSGIGAASSSGKKSDWVNPATSSAASVLITSSSSESSSSDQSAAAVLAGRDSSKRFASKNQPKQWVQFSLLGYSLSLRKYSLRNPDVAPSSKPEYLKGWKLEASKDGRPNGKWVLLDERKNEQSMSTKSAAAAFDIRQNQNQPQQQQGNNNGGNASSVDAAAAREMYSHFRLTSTQPNSGNQHTLVLSGLELYGTLKKDAAKPAPFVTPYYAVIQLNSAAVQPVVVPAAAGGSSSASSSAASGGAGAKKAASPLSQQLVDGIKQITLPLRIRAPEKPQAAAASEPVAAAQEKDKPAPSAPAAAAAAAKPSDGAEKPAAAAASAAKDNQGGGKSGSAQKGSKPAQAQQQGGKQDGKQDGKGKPSDEERLARQRAAEERRAKQEEDRRRRAERERLAELAEQEASRHVQLSVVRWTDLKGDSRARHPVINAFIRSRMVAGIEVELAYPQARPSSAQAGAAAPLKPSVKAWGNYVPTAAFHAAVAELVRRHGGGVSVTPSLRGQPALDARALSSFLSYSGLENAPAIKEQVDLMRKQAALPTGLELEQLLQILCKIAGADATIPLPPRNDAPVPPADAAVVLPPPPAPAAESGAYLLSQWLWEAGYDLNVQWHCDTQFEQSLRFQQPAYWRTANRGAAATLATSSLGPPSSAAAPSGGADGDDDQTYQPVLAESFVELLHELAEREGEKELLDMYPSQVRLSDADWQRISVQPSGADGETHLPLPALRLRYALLRLFNQLFASLLPLIDLRRTRDPRSLAGLVASCKPFLFPAVKNQFLSVILDATAEECKTPAISVNRLALQLRKARGEGSGDFLSDSLFAHVQAQLSQIDPFHLRPVRPAGTEPFLSFSVEFRGEQVVGEGGPFRQLFSDLARELQDHVALLQPTPNNTNKLGDDRSAFCLVPSATTSRHLQFYQCLGLLFGCCLRTSVRFPLELCRPVWKALVGEELTASDLYSVDAACMDALAFIEHTSDEDALAALAQPFTTKLSDGTLVELKEQGEDQLVTVANRREYVRLVVAARLVESQAQVEAIRRGLAQIVPLQLLNLLTARELELLICGRTSIDVDLLRRHTVYSGVDASAPHIQLFWQVLQQMDQHQRRLFIRFSWAQERLPLDDAEFQRTHTRLLIKPSPYHNPDQALPRSDTCFFNLELPAYSSAKVMMAKLLYAITSDSSMNADERSIRDAEQEQGRRNNRDRHRLEEEDY